MYNGKGGGVALFILERTDLNAYVTVNLECFFVEINNSEIGKNVVGAIYRPHNSTLDSFSIDFEKVLNLTSKSKAEYIFAGDYNIDLLKTAYT